MTETEQRLDAAARNWRDNGLTILPEYLPSSELQQALAELPTVFPTPDEFHDDVDPDRNARYYDEFGGITDFPFVSGGDHRVLLGVDH